MLAARFDIPEIAPEAAFEPHYNVAPRMEVQVVSERDGARTLAPRRWGLVPSWAESPAIGDRMINARAESIHEKAAFQRAFGRRRCLIPADGFYEWQAGSGAHKVPMYIYAADGAPLAFAGLWESWRDQEDPHAAWMRTCTVITTTANATMRPIHDRMPVLLDPRDWDEWLGDDASETDLAELLRPAPDNVLAFHPVSTRVNSARNDDPALIVREDPLTLFP